MYKKISSRKSIILAVLFAILVAINAIVVTNVKSSKKIAAATSQNNLAAIEYDELADSDIYAKNTETGDECRNVIFKAFFPKDIDGDGQVEEMLGSCEDNANLYIDIGVQNGGRLVNGRIAVNGQNFDLETTELADDVLAQNYIGKNIRLFQLKTMQSGTQKLIIGNIHTKLTTVESFSQVSQITLTGTYYPEEGDAIEISKTIDLTVDILGDNATTRVTTTGGYYDRKELGGYNEDIPLSFKFKVTQSGLINKKNVVEMQVGAFEGLYPNSVNVSDVPEEEYEYDQENHILRINHTTQEKSVEYTVTFLYPHALYTKVYNGSAMVHTYDAIYKITAHNICYNNPQSESGEEYVTKDDNTLSSITIRSVESIIIPPPTHYFDVGIAEGELLSDGKTKAVSKTEFLRKYDEYDPESADKLGYEINWDITRAKTGDPTTYRVEDRDASGDRFNGNLYLEDYLQTSKIKIKVVGSIMPRGGKIYVYETETNELVKEFTTTGYSNTYTYTFDKPVKDIKIETTNDSGATGQINITCYRTFNIEKMKSEISRDTIGEIYQFLTAAVCGGSNIGNTFSKSATLSYAVQKNEATLTVDPSVLAIDAIDPVNQTYKIKIPESSLERPEWTNGYFEITIPKLGISYLELVSGANIPGASTEVVENENNYIIKVKTTTDVSGKEFTVKCKVMPNQISNATSFRAKLEYLNENCEVYVGLGDDEHSEKADTNDIDHDGNTDDIVGVNYADLSISAPSTFVSYTTISNYNDKGSVTLSPKVALINNETRTAKVNVFLYNGYNDRTLKNFAIVGRIPCEGNTYVDGEDLGSHFTTKMTSNGLTLPENLQGKATIYYSENANASRDLNDAENGWTAIGNITSFDNVKSYMIIPDENAIQLRNMYQISYEVQIPQGLQSNLASYAAHKIYYDVLSEEGSYSTSTSPSRLGLRVIRYYDIELQKYKEGTTLPVSGAYYRVYGTNSDGAVYAYATSDENGKIILKNAIVNQQYTLQEIYNPTNYELSDKTSEFIVREDENGDLTAQVLSGDLLDQQALRLTKNAENKDVLVSDAPIYNTPKYKLIINKVDSVTKEKMSGVQFQLTGKGLYDTDENGQATISNLSFQKEYTLSEAKREFYYKRDDITFEIQKDGDNYTVVSESEELQGAVITDPQDSDLVVVEITIENEPIPVYNLKVVKENIKDETSKLADASFVLSRDDMGDSKIYTTGEEGTFTVSGLYQYVDGKNATGKYTLTEFRAPKGYVKNTEDIEFVVSKNAAGKYIVNITNEENLTSVKDAKFDGNTLVITITDSPVFKLVKMDYTNHEPLANVDFVIYELGENNEIIDYAKDVNGDYVGTPNEKGDWLVTTNALGIIQLELPAGTYKAVEYNYPEGYVINGTEQVFTIGNKLGKANWSDIVVAKPTIEEQAINPAECNPSSIVTETNKIEINKIEDLVRLSNQLKGGQGSASEGYEVKLKCDLDFTSNDSYDDPDRTDFGDVNGDGTIDTLKTELTTGAGFYPIGDDPSSAGTGGFSGTFDGQNHTISNLYENRTSDYSGLFGCAYAITVKNLTVTGTITTTGGYCGGICGVVYQGYGKFENCTSNVNMPSCSYGSGGILGAASTNAQGISIKSCINIGNIASSNSHGIGGILGYSESNGCGADIESCENHGNISGSIAGGIYGYSMAGSGVIIKSCENTGKVSGSSYAGGIIGEIYGGSGFIVESCENHYKLTTTNSTSSGGGIVGYGYGITYAIIKDCQNDAVINCDSSSNYMGGIIGQSGSTNTSIKNCTNKGAITGHYVGGISGYTKNNLIAENCENTEKITGAYRAGGLVGCTGSTSFINNCTNRGDVEQKGTSGSYLGGIISYAGSAVYIDDTYNYGKVTR